MNCTRDEMDFLLDGARTALNMDIEASDVLGSIGGCRPLVAPPGGKTIEVKRNHEIRTDHDGLVTVVGGKLTTSRHMAQQTVDAAQKVLGQNRRCRTSNATSWVLQATTPKPSWHLGGLASHLGERYGTEARFVTDILAEDPSLNTPIVEGLPYVEGGEIIYAARHEMARSVDDILSRRTRARMMARDASAAAAARVGELLMKELDLPASIVEAK